MRKISCILFLAALALSGCDETSTSTDQPQPVVPSSQGPMSQLVASASSDAADAFQAIFQRPVDSAGSPLGADKKRLQESNASLRRVWESDRADSRAAFGLAITGLALKIDEMAGTMDRAYRNGLAIGGGSSLAATTPSAIEESFPVLARMMATPGKAPLIHELQDSLELLMLPTLDEAVNLLGVAWSDPAFSMRVAVDTVLFPGDTLVLDRSDVGFALSILQAVRAQIRWIVSYDFDIDMDGSYAWLDTLDNIEDMDALTSPQEAALRHYEKLLSDGSPFLAVRAGKESTLASVPTELKTALQRSREATVLAYALKAGKTNVLRSVRSIAMRDSLVRVLDSAISWLSGPRTLKIYKRTTCSELRSGTYSSQSLMEVQDTIRTQKVDELYFFHSWTSTEYLRHRFGDGRAYHYTWHSSGSSTVMDETAEDILCDTSYDISADGYRGSVISSTVASKTISLTVDLSKLLATRDFKAFHPRYRWNPTSDWGREGPVSYVTATNSLVSYAALCRYADSLGFAGVRDRLTWADPTFGGAFPEFKTSAAWIDFYRDAVKPDQPQEHEVVMNPLEVF